MRPSPGADEIETGHRGRQLHARGKPDQQPGHPPTRAVHRVQHGQHEQHVDLPVVEIAAQWLDPDADGGPDHRNAMVTPSRQQSLADPHHSVERGDGAQLPGEREKSEREQVQRIEHDSREGRVSERKREVGRLVGIDVVVELARMIEHFRAADIDMQVDEVGAVRHQVGQRESRGDADRQQHRRRGGQAGGHARSGRSGGSGGVYAPDSSEPSP